MFANPVFFRYISHITLFCPSPIPPAFTRPQERAISELPLSGSVPLLPMAMKFSLTMGMMFKDTKGRAREGFEATPWGVCQRLASPSA